MLVDLGLLVCLCNLGISLISGSVTLSIKEASPSTPSVTAYSDSNSDFFKREIFVETKLGPLFIISSISSTIPFSKRPLLGEISLISFSSSSIYSIGSIFLTNSSKPSYG